MKLPPASPVNYGTKSIPPCPTCRKSDWVDEEEQNGSSQRWFVCNQCGRRYAGLVARE